MECDGKIASTFDQRSANEREDDIPQARENYVSTRKQQNTLQLTTIMKITVKTVSIDLSRVA